MIAGVSAGLARHLRVDVTLVRIAFVVATVIGGVGIAAYVAALLLVPEEGSDEAMIHTARSGRAPVILGILLLGAGAAAALSNAHLGFDGGLFWALALAGAGTYLLLKHGDGLEEHTATVPPAQQPRTESSAATAPAPEPVATAAPAPAPKTSRTPTRLVAGVMLLAGGALAAVAALGSDISWQAAMGILVIVAGGALVAGAFFGASPWLALPPLALAAVVAGLGAADVQLRGPVGDRAFHPATTADLRDSYRMAIGNLDVDLRDVSLPPGTTNVKVVLGMGQARVHVPEGVALRVAGHAGAGTVDISGERGDGTGVDRNLTVPARGKPVLLLDARVGMGELDVVRDGAGR